MVAMLTGTALLALESAVLFLLLRVAPSSPPTLLILKTQGGFIDVCCRESCKPRYLRYPSSYTPTTTGTCTFTINKVSADICQLRLDYDSFSGFGTTTPAGTCSDSLEVKGQTGKNPPSICGTNTGYHSMIFSVISHLLLVLLSVR